MCDLTMFPQKDRPVRCETEDGGKRRRFVVNAHRSTDNFKSLPSAPLASTEGLGKTETRAEMASCFLFVLGRK